MGAINAFRVAADNSHFISASDDGTVKVWDSHHWSHLETPTCDDWDDMCLAEAKATYTGQSGRILDVAPYGGGGGQISGRARLIMVQFTALLWLRVG